MRHSCLRRPVCHCVSLDGWIDWDVYTVTVGLFSDGRSFLPAASPLTPKGQRCLKGRFTEKSARVPGAYQGTCQDCSRRSCVSNVVTHRPAVSTKPLGTLGTLVGGAWQNCLCSDCYNSVHKLSHICFVDVNPEVNVQIMD